MAAAKLVPRLPRQVLLRLADLLGLLMSIFDRQGRAVALNNLEVAFGDRFSPRQRKRIARESFQHFARSMVDLLWTPRLTRENYARYLESEGMELLDTGPEFKGRVMVACYHYSNFEWLSWLCATCGFTATIINQQFKNSLLDPIFKRLRELSGHEMVPRERGITRLYKALRRGGRTAVLVDLTVPPSQGAVVIECFGLKTSVTSAHAWLHHNTGTPIVPAHCEPLANGRYRIVFHRRIDDATKLSEQQIAQACWDSFEPYVRKNPAPWLWMYKHWRYRPSDARRPYPFYANIEPRFDKLVRAAQSSML